MTIKKLAADRPRSGGTPLPPGGLRQLVDDALAGFVGSQAYPCLGARSVVHRQAYEVAVYDRLGDWSAATALSRDLAQFGARVVDSGWTSFIAVFGSPSPTTEAQFSELLWRQLQRLHECDRRTFAWDDTVSDDPADPQFSFSVGGRAYFVIGMHAGSSRWARRFAWPTLVFNPHQQFVALRDAGKYDRVRSAIRDREVGLQGSVNPTLRDHGADSEARQYAGEAVPAGWRCPLDVHPR